MIRRCVTWPVIVALRPRPNRETTKTCAAPTKRLDAPLSLRGRSLSSAGHVKERARRVRRLVGQKPENRGRDLVDLPASLHRNRFFQAINAIRFTATGMHLGVDEARPNRIDADTFLGGVARPPDGPGVDGAFGGGIIDIFSG